MLTVIGHSDLITNFSGDLRYLTVPATDAQVSMVGLKSLRPLLVLASLCPFDYADGVDKAWLPRQAWQQWLGFRQIISESPTFRILEDLSETDTNDAEKIQLLLHLEGAEPIEKPAELEQFVALGGRALSLTWNLANQYAGGAMSDGRLTDMGKELVERIKAAGLLLDVSHLNEASFWDVLNVYDGPLFASHSNARAVADSPRNLSDRQLHALRERQAWVGVSFARSHLTTRDRSTIDDVIAHFDHLRQELGESLIGLGTDWGGIVSGPPKDLESVDKLPNLWQALQSRGWTAEQIDGIRGKNFLETLDKKFQGSLR